MSPETRTLLLSIKSLLLRAVDLIDRACVLGKYKTQMVEMGDNDSMAGVVKYD